MCRSGHYLRSVRKVNELVRWMAPVGTAVADAEEAWPEQES